MPTTLTTPTYIDLGNTGPVGPQGPQGVKGDTGNTGSRGVAGPSGPLGPIGITPDIDVSSNTGAAGTSATVTKTGTAENPNFLFTIPRGDKGDTGTIEASYYLTPGEPMFTLDPSNGNTFINGTLDVSGNGTFERDLTINGILRAGTLEVGSSEIAITDPILQLGSNNIDDDLNRGISFKYFEDSSKTGFFGYDQTDNTFVFRPVASDDATTGVFTGDYGTAKFGKVVVGNGTNSSIVESNGNNNLVLQTGNTSTGTITIVDGTNSEIAIQPQGTGNINLTTAGNINLSTTGVGENSDINLSSAGTIELECSTVRTGKSNTNAAITTDGASNLTLHTNNDTFSGKITIANGADGDISLTPNGSGNVVISKADINSGTIDGTTIATSNITVGTGKTLDVSAGGLNTSSVQNKTIIQGAGANVDIGSFDLRAQTLTADSLTSGRVVIAGTNGLLTQDSDLTFSGETLTATKISGILQTASQTNITSVGALDNGSITSGFGSINNGSSIITTTGAITGGSITDGTATLSSGALSSASSVTASGAISGGSASFGTSTAATVSTGGLVTINNITQSSVYTDGALIVDGGVGIAKDLRVNGTIHGSISGSISGAASQVVLTTKNDNETYYPTFAASASGNEALYTDNTGTAGIGLTYNPYSNTLTTKTFVGALTGNATNVTGTVAIANGGTGATSASAARGALSAASSGSNSDITQLTGLSTALTVGQGGTGSTTAPMIGVVTATDASGANDLLGLGTGDSPSFAGLTVGGSSLSFTTVTTSTTLTLGNTIINTGSLTVTLPTPTAGALITIYSPSYDYTLDSNGGGATPTISANTVTVCIGTGASAGDWVAYASGVVQSF